MKIIDIISEQQDLNEGLGTAALSFIGKLLGYGPKAQAAEKLARVWAKNMAAGKPLANANKVIGNSLAGDKAVIDTARKSAGKLLKQAEYDAAKLSAKAGVKAVGGKLAGGLNITDAALKWFARWQYIGQPIYDYNKSMAPWDAKLKSGEITKEQYDYVREKYLSDLVGRIGTGLLVSGIVRTTVLPLVTGLKLMPKTEVVGTILSNVSRAGTVYMLSWLNSDEGRKIIANIFAQGVIGDEVSPYLGGTMANWIDKIKGKAEEAEQQGAKKSDTSSTPADADKKTTSTEPTAAPASANISGMDSSPDAPMSTPAKPSQPTGNAQPAKPATQTAKPAAADIDIPSNLERDPATGKLRIKTSL